MLRFALLGLLADRPRHGYELKTLFEELLAGTWPVNIGQIYTTLARLERDGLVECETVAQDATPDRKVYCPTEDGLAALKGWLNDAGDGPVRLKDELFLKVLVHRVARTGNASEILGAQREVLLRQLAELVRLQQAPGQEPFTALLVEGAVLHTEADLKWIAACEERLDALPDDGEAP